MTGDERRAADDGPPAPDEPTIATPVTQAQARALAGLSPEFTAPDLGDGTGDPRPLRVTPRWARILVWPWVLAALVWTVSAGVIAAGSGRIPADAAAIPVLVLVAVSLRRIAVSVDADALILHGPWRSRRILWAAVSKVEIDRDARLEPVVHVWVRGSDRPIGVTATWTARRDDLDRFLAAAAGPIAAHRIPVETP